LKKQNDEHACEKIQNQIQIKMQDEVNN
jgi:hypothetical protein